MRADDELRGHKIKLEGKQYVYSDSGLSTALNWKKTPCGHCGLLFTKEGHDGCLGTLPQAMNACCGHGQVAEAYVQNLDGSTIQGADAIRMIEILKAERRQMG